MRRLTQDGLGIRLLRRVPRQQKRRPRPGKYHSYEQYGAGKTTYRLTIASRCCISHDYLNNCPHCLLPDNCYTLDPGLSSIYARQEEKKSDGQYLFEDPSPTGIKRLLSGASLATALNSLYYARDMLLSRHITAAKQKFNDKFWRNSLIFFIGSMLAGLLNYLFYPVLGRLLPLHDFGEVQALFSILLDIVVFFTAISMVITNITANASKDYKHANIIELEQATLVLLYVLFIIWLILTPFLGTFLKIDSTYPLVAIYAVIIISLTINTRQAFLQGRQDFWGVTVGTLLGAGGKLVFSWLLVYAGYGVIGAIAGLALGQLLNAAYATYRSRKMGLSFPLLRLQFRGFRSVLPEMRQVLPAFTVSLAISILYSSDVIIIKHYFSPDVAGQYSGIAAIGRIIFFLTAPIVLVMFSSIKLSNHVQHNFEILRRSLFLLMAIGGSVLLLCVLFPRPTVALLLGARYLPAAHYLPMLSVALWLVAVANMLLLFDLALRRRRIVVLSLVSLGAILSLAAVHHHTVNQVIGNISYVTLTLIVTLLGLHLVDIRRNRTMKI